jgi:hypothetical protein
MALAHAVSLRSAGGITAEAERLVLDAGLPLFDGSQRAVRAMGRYADFVAASSRCFSPCLAKLGDHRAAAAIRQDQIRCASRSISGAAAISCSISEGVNSAERKAGARAVRLETNRALTDAIGLYRSAGYAEIPAFSDEACAP